MTDPTQFIVEFSIVHRILQHEGVLGVGRDFLTGKQCSINSYTDNIDKHYIMQLYESPDNVFISNKLGNIAKVISSFFVSNLTRILFVCTRKNSKEIYQLAIFYDVSGFGGTSLNTILSNKRLHDQKFKDEELIEFFWEIADLLFLSCQHTLEFLQITPVNIFYRAQRRYGYKYYPNNMGINPSNSKMQKRYYNPNDMFWSKDRNPQSAVRTVMFIFGMTLLEMVSMLEPNSLYESGFINQNALKKRIEAIKIINDPLICRAIQGLLKIDEYQRLTLENIYDNIEWLKLRKVSYFQDKKNFYHYKSFKGISDYACKNAIGEVIDNELNTFRGTFLEGKLHGIGVSELRNSDTLIGLFNNETFVEGLQLHQNQYLTIGKCKGGEIMEGHRFVLNLSLLKNPSNQMIGFSGQLKNDQYLRGTKYYKDGSHKQINVD